MHKQTVHVLPLPDLHACICTHTHTRSQICETACLRPYKLAAQTHTHTRAIAHTTATTTIENIPQVLGRT